MSGPARLDPGTYIRQQLTDRIEAHTWADPDGHPPLKALAPGRGWCDACVREAVREAVAAGYRVADVIAAFDGLVPPAHLDVVRRAATGAGTSEPRRRGRAVPDVEAAMRSAIANLHQTKLTWPSVAAQIALDRDLDALDPSTLRRWATEDHLPHPGNPCWRART